MEIPLQSDSGCSTLQTAFIKAGPSEGQVEKSDLCRLTSFCAALMRTTARTLVEG
jgi:hypothetical protein